MGMVRLFRLDGYLWKPDQEEGGRRYQTIQQTQVVELLLPTSSLIYISGCSRGSLPVSVEWTHHGDQLHHDVRSPILARGSAKRGDWRPHHVDRFRFLTGLENKFNRSPLAQR